jgi:Tol biopolymer transport system component
MKLPLPIWLLLVSSSLAGCAGVQVQARVESPAAATATAVAQAHPSPTPVPRLGELAYISGGDIWTKRLPAGSARRLTHDGRDLAPMWSPSGRWIAFQRSEQLWVMRAGGSDARSLGPFSGSPGSQAAWSPAVDRLAYVSDGGLTEISASGSQHCQLVSPTALAGHGVQAIAWSPNGRQIAYEDLQRPGVQATEQGLWRVSVCHGIPRTVYLNKDPMATQSHLAGWSPDGKYLLYWRGIMMSASMAADGEPLMEVPVAGGTPKRIVPAMLSYRSFLAWSPNGQKLALIDGGGRETGDDKRLAVAMIPGTAHMLTDTHHAAVDPAWSPNGHWIAVSSEPVTRQTENEAYILPAISHRRIWLIAADGSTERQLTKTGFEDEHPQWSPDGSYILFARMHDRSAQLWLMRADGSNRHRVVSQLTPSPIDAGYYGHFEWDEFYDWWKG